MHVGCFRFMTSLSGSDCGSLDQDRGGPGLVLEGHVPQALMSVVVGAVVEKGFHAVGGPVITDLGFGNPAFTRVLESSGRGLLTVTTPQGSLVAATCNRDSGADSNHGDCGNRSGYQLQTRLHVSLPSSFAQ